MSIDPISCLFNPLEAFWEAEKLTKTTFVAGAALAALRVYRYATYVPPPPPQSKTLDSPQSKILDLPQDPKLGELVQEYLGRELTVPAESTPLQKLHSELAAAKEVLAKDTVDLDAFMRLFAYVVKLERAENIYQSNLQPADDWGLEMIGTAKIILNERIDALMRCLTPTALGTLIESHVNFNSRSRSRESEKALCKAIAFGQVRGKETAEVLILELHFMQALLNHTTLNYEELSLLGLEFTEINRLLHPPAGPQDLSNWVFPPPVNRRDPPDALRKAQVAFRDILKEYLSEKPLPQVKVTRQLS